jgi:nucleoside-diphosphate-sugar epimerase
MRVLVTGAAGFIGSAISKRLITEGHTVIGIDNLVTGKLENLQDVRKDMYFRTGDIQNRELMETICQEVEVIFHEAALPSVPKSVLDPLTSHRHNVDGTLNLLLAARERGVRRVIYAASSSAYGESATLPKHEEMPTAPISPYAVQKLAGEHYMQSFSRVYGMETVCLRYFNVFGPFQAADSPYSGVLAKFITSMLHQTAPTIFGDGQQSRDFTYIENVVQANLLAAAAPAEKVSGRVYNIACGERHTLLETFNELARITGFSGQPIFASARKGDILDSQASILRAMEDLGYSPSVSFSDGLQRTVGWYAEKLQVRR